MNSKRLYYLLISLIILLVASLVGGAYGANILLEGQAKKLIEARSASVVLDQQQTQLTRAKASIVQYSEIGKIAKTIVPQDKDQAQTVRELVAIANKNGIRLANISFPSSNLGASTGVTAPAVGGAATTAPTKSAAGAKAGDLSQLIPLKTISGVYTLQIIVQSDPTIAIAYDKFITFLNDLEQNRRTALVSAITLTPDSKDSTKVAFTLNLDEYIKP